MDNYAELIRQMAEAYLNATKSLAEENAALRSEVVFLRQELAALRGRTDEWWEGGKPIC